MDLYNKMTKAAKTKTVVLAALSLVNIINPIGSPYHHMYLSSCIPMFIFGVLGTLIMIRIKVPVSDITKPSWNDNLFKTDNRLSSTQFGAYFFIVVGFSILIGTGIKYHSLNDLGILPLITGVGILLGVQLALQWAKKRAT